MINLVCPECKTLLHSDAEKHICGHCQRNYAIRKGIACFNETNHYYGELSQHEMQEFLEMAEKSGWENAVSTYLPSKNPELIRTIKDSKRVSWVPLVGLKGNETVLDFGCGLGGVSSQLTELVSQVVSLDGCYDRIRFLQIRKDQEGLQNITLVCNGKAHKLPFPDACFDLIILNMVFPYLAATLPQYAKSTAENIILREVTRTLKPGGRLYLSVRNKHCLQAKKNAFWFRADLDSTFNLQGYKYYEHLLLASGMTNIKNFWILPDYKCPVHFVPLGGDPVEIDKSVDQIKEFSSLKKRFAKLLSRMGRLRYLAHTILFVAQRGTTAR